MTTPNQVEQDVCFPAMSETPVLAQIASPTELPPPVDSASQEQRHAARLRASRLRAIEALRRPRN